MKAEIISIGTELLLGEIVNTNAAFLAEQLPLLGIDLYYIATVGDNKQRLIKALEQASQRADVVITTGGLGPTQDDITRESIADFLQENITIDPALVKRLEDLFARYKIEMSPTNIKQAGIIPSAKVIDNDFGSAPGWWIEKNNKIIITLPGPTGEVKNMWASYVFPELKKRSNEIIMSRTLKLFNISESKVDEIISQYLSSTNPTVATYAKADGIQVRLTAKGANEIEVESILAQKEKDIRLLLEDNIWSTDSENIEDTLLKLIEERNLTLATIESGIGGLLVKTISESKYSPKCYQGGMVIPNELIETILKNSTISVRQYDKISPEIASALASEIRRTLQADIGISITTADGKSSQNSKTNSLYIGIDYMGNKRTFTRTYPGQSFQRRRLAVTSAFYELRKIIYGGKHASNN
jgi:nicotinamide-nucleotide amidase